MKPKTKNLLNPYKAAAIFLPIIAILLISARDYFISLTKNWSPCIFYSITHLYCPSCGNTRSLKALLHGDILSSLRYNIVPSLLLIFMLLAYIELVTYSFSKHVRLLPRKLSYYLVLLTILAIYLIFRNFIPYLTP